LAEIDLTKDYNYFDNYPRRRALAKVHNALLATIQILLSVCCVALFSTHTFAGDSSPTVRFVNEYIRELEDAYAIQTNAKKELSESSGIDKLMSEIRISTRTTIDLNTNISALKEIKLDAQCDDFRAGLIQIYGQKIGLHRQIIDDATEMLSGPKPGVDYGKIMAHAPQMTAMNESLDKTIFDITRGIFLCVVDRTSEKNGILTRLVMTNNERKQMIRVWTHNLIQ
jgi:hypothetical protein